MKKIVLLLIMSLLLVACGDTKIKTTNSDIGDSNITNSIKKEGKENKKEEDESEEDKTRTEFIISSEWETLEHPELYIQIYDLMFPKYTRLIDIVNKLEENGYEYTLSNYLEEEVTLDDVIPEEGYFFYINTEFVQIKLNMLLKDSGENVKFKDLYCFIDGDSFRLLSNINENLWCTDLGIRYEEEYEYLQKFDLENPESFLTFNKIFSNYKLEESTETENHIDYMYKKGEIFYEDDYYSFTYNPGIMVIINKNANNPSIFYSLNIVDGSFVKK